MYMYTSHAEHSKGLLFKDGMLSKVDAADDLMVYSQHHCWILFTSLCLSLSNMLNSSNPCKHALTSQNTNSLTRYVAQMVKMFVAFGG